MSGAPINSTNPLAALRRLAVKTESIESCDFCSAALQPDHRHLLELSNRKIRCVCIPCGLRFENAVSGKFKLIPATPRALPDFRLSDELWNSFALPINLAFFFHDLARSKVTALFPSPGGATESLLSFKDWGTLVADNPNLAEMQPDVEALLINRVADARNYFIAPMDACFELVGTVRKNWRGLSGGDEVWRAVASFFHRLSVKVDPESEAVCLT